MQSSDEFPFLQSYEWQTKIFLGEGSYGKVYKVHHKTDGQYYAVKQMNMQEFNHDASLMQSLKGQIQVTMQVNSQYTVQMKEYKVQKHFTYMVLELCDTDLRKELASKKFTEAECVHVYQELMRGFQILVGKGYIHRDIKPANVLVKNHHYKVADFGFACKADVFGKKKLNDICGTPIYMAPQLLDQKAYTAKSDIWSLGLMLYQMIFGYVPWPCRSLTEYANAIKNRPLTFPYDAKIGQNTKDFIKRSLVVDEEKRMGWAQVFNHPLVKKKQTGELIKPVIIGDYLKQFMKKLQADILKHNINLRDILSKRKKQKLNLQQFTKLIRDIDITTTTHQIKNYFDYLDAGKTGYVKWEVIEDAIAHVDYRNTNNVLDRKLDQLVAILKERNEEPQELFNKIDENKSGSLDWSEFSRFITMIAPCYTKQQMLQFFKLLDTDKSGLISKVQFLSFLQDKLPSGKEHKIQLDRANRNISHLVSYIKWCQISPANILKIADSDKNQLISLKELSVLLTKLNFHISEEEVLEMFTVMNKDKSNDISISELMDILK